MAILAAAFAAYGTDPSWATLQHGMEIIYAARRLQWPVLALSIVLCLVVLGLVVSGKRRAWWLLGLAPVLTLFVHRFTTNPLGAMQVADNPATVAADRAEFVHDEDYVVGVNVDGAAYAYPYRQLFLTPVVLQNEYQTRFIVVWSAYANRAIASRVDRDYRARDLEIVSMPANALLVYNTRYGQFINGVTGATSTGEIPHGFGKPMVAIKTTWKEWHRANHDSKVMLPTNTEMQRLPAAPLAPRYSVGPTTQPVDMRVVFVPGNQALALRAEQIAARPLNLNAGTSPVLVFRDPNNGMVRSFDRRIDVDLFPRFARVDDAKKPAVFMMDVDTNTNWSAGGVAVEGDKSHKGVRLSPVAVDTDVYFGVMKFWYPSMKLIDVPADATYKAAPTTVPEAPKAAVVHRRRRRR